MINIITATMLADYANGLDQAFNDAVTLSIVIEVCRCV
jgi:hypothetical protein